MLPLMRLLSHLPGGVSAPFLLALTAILLTVSSSAMAIPDSSQAASICDSAEACFRAAMALSIAAVSPDDRLKLKIERLRMLQERHPGSVWARRAGLLIGVLLRDRD